MQIKNGILYISNENLIAGLTPYGASLTDLRLKAFNRPLVLGYDNIDAYKNECQFMGAVIGRYANRISDARFKLHDREIILEENEKGVGHLHGGSAGYGVSEWQTKSHSHNRCCFELTEADGHAGYHGNLTVEACYELIEPATLRLTFYATCDQDTIINICHHPYFNFSGGQSITSHRLWLAANHYLPATNDLIPTGNILETNGSDFDFKTSKQLKDRDYNNTTCLHMVSNGALAHAATLSCDEIEMDLWTTQPGIHLYNGYKLGSDNIGHLGVPYPAYSGICLEPQAWPNSPNEAHFPLAVLRVGERYEQINEYRF